MAAGRKLPVIQLTSLEITNTRKKGGLYVNKDPLVFLYCSLN